MPESSNALHVVVGDFRVTGHCDCCGTESMLASGFVHDSSGTTHAAYFVHWTVSHPEKGAHFDLVLGRWGDGTQSSDRAGASLWFVPQKGFMVIDADERPFSKDQGLFATLLKRTDIVGTELAPRVFAVVDAVWLGDARIGDVRQSHIA
jgi:hypothetical protein